MTGMLNLSRRPEDDRQDAEEALLERLAAILETDVSHLSLAPSSDAARQALFTSGLILDQDLTSEGVLALDQPSEAAVCLYRIGPATAPVSVISAKDAQQSAGLRKHLGFTPKCLIDTGSDCISPGARLAARQDRVERDKVLSVVVNALSDLVGETPLVTGRGLVFQQTGPSVLKPHGLVFAEDGDQLLGYVPDADAARHLQDFLGLRGVTRATTVRRTTKETDIALSVDLDSDGASVDTGVAFFDHMLEQIARHGGIRLDVICKGDVDVDAHHTIEDVCLALGDALRTALGDKRGIARFGFEVPMDETRAGVWIDLSGRPYALFEGDIPGERVGDFPVEMCEHAFRSLAETLKAAIHVKVEGENAHHMVESCFKAFGRALRMAVRIEGDALPSTKGVL